MRRLSGALCLGAIYLGSISAAQAGSGNPAVQKTKTGILPAGGLYSIYAVQCAGGGEGAVASMDRRTTWCALRGEELRCSGSLGQARKLACDMGEVAAAGDESAVYLTPDETPLTF